MFGFPALPSWDGLHPLAVHFPIALLLVAPIFVVIAMISRARAASLLVGASVLVVIGAGTALLATATGDAAEGATDGIPAAEAILHRHEELAEVARNLFIVLAVVLSFWTVIALRSSVLVSRKVYLGGCALYLVLHGAASLVLVNAAHEGGRLVHELGVGSVAAASSLQVESTAAARPMGHDEDDD